MFCTLSVLRNSPLHWAWIAAPMADHALLATVGLEYCVEGPGIICQPCGFAISQLRAYFYNIIAAAYRSVAMLRPLAMCMWQTIKTRLP
jgi:hypothetical protein